MTIGDNNGVVRGGRLFQGSLVRTTAQLVVRQLLTAEFSSNGLGIHLDVRSG